MRTWPHSATAASQRNPGRKVVISSCTPECCAGRFWRLHGMLTATRGQAERWSCVGARLSASRTSGKCCVHGRASGSIATATYPRPRARGRHRSAVDSPRLSEGSTAPPWPISSRLLDLGPATAFSSGARRLQCTDRAVRFRSRSAMRAASGLSSQNSCPRPTRSRSAPAMAEVASSVSRVMRPRQLDPAPDATAAPRPPAEPGGVAADLSTAEGTAKVAQSVLDHWGGIDILVNVLGGSSAPGGGFAALDDARWFAELNRIRARRCRLDRALLPAMLAQGSGVIGSGMSALRLSTRLRPFGRVRAHDSSLCGKPEDVLVVQLPATLRG